CVVTAVWRGALIASGLLQSIVVIMIQSLVIIGLAFAVGARFSASSVLLQLALAGLLGGAVCALSDGLALVARQEETLTGAVQFVVFAGDIAVVRADGGESRARLDRRRGAVQPRQLVRRRGPFGRVVGDRLVARRRPSGA